MCQLDLDVRNSGKLYKFPELLAWQTEKVLESLDKLGIIGRVDEVTGYQEMLSKDALAILFEKMLAPELQTYQINSNHILICDSPVTEMGRQTMDEPTANIRTMPFRIFQLT